METSETPQENRVVRLLLAKKEDLSLTEEMIVENRKLYVTITEQRKQVEALRKNLDDKLKEIEELEQVTRECRATVHSQNLEIQQLRATVDSQDHQIRDIRNSIAEKVKENDDFKKLSVRHSQRYRALKTDTGRQIAELKTSFEHCEQQRLDGASQIGSLNQHIHDMREEHKRDRATLLRTLEDNLFTDFKRIFQTAGDFTTSTSTEDSDNHQPFMESDIETGPESNNLNYLSDSIQAAAMGEIGRNSTSPSPPILTPYHLPSFPTFMGNEGPNMPERLEDGVQPDQPDGNLAACNSPINEGPNQTLANLETENSSMTSGSGDVQEQPSSSNRIRSHERVEEEWEFSKTSEGIVKLKRRKIGDTLEPVPGPSNTTSMDTGIVSWMTSGLVDGAPTAEKSVEFKYSEYERIYAYADYDRVSESWEGNVLHGISDRVTTTNQTENYQCLCGRSFRKLSSLNTHIYNYKNPKCCAFCDVGILPYFKWIRHVKTCHDDVSKGKFNCRQCNRKFSNRKNLRNHKARVH